MSGRLQCARVWQVEKRNGSLIAMLPASFMYKELQFQRHCRMMTTSYDCSLCPQHPELDCWFSFWVVRIRSESISKFTFFIFLESRLMKTLEFQRHCRMMTTSYDCSLCPQRPAQLSHLSFRFFEYVMGNQSFSARHLKLDYCCWMLQDAVLCSLSFFSA